MKKTWKKSLVAILSGVAVCCASVGAAFLPKTTAFAEAVQVNASDVLTVSDGLTATYNVSGVEKQPSLIKDTRKGIHFSSGENKGNAAEGESISFKNTLSGLFEMDFRVYTQNAGAIDWNGGDPWYAHNNGEEIREVGITLTDVDANKSFTIYIQGGTSWDPNIPNARVAYGEAKNALKKTDAMYGTGIRYGYSGDSKDYDDTKTPYNGGTLGSKEYNTQIRGTSFTNSFLHSTVVGFDPYTKEVYEYNFKSSANQSDYAKLLNRRVILDLDETDHLANAGTGANDLLQCKFNRYTVKFTLTDVTGASETGSQGKDEQANFLIYSLNGQSLGGENGVLTSSVAPGLAATVSDGKQYVSYPVPQPILNGVLGGTFTFDGEVEVIAPDQSVALNKQAYTNGLAFTPMQFGEYKVVYSGVKDGSGNERKTLAADGTYSGATLTYTYTFNVEKALDITGDATQMITTSGLNVSYNVAGIEKHPDLTNDTQKGIAFETTASGEEAKGSSVAFNNVLTGLFELNFRAYTQETDTSTDWWEGGDWSSRILTEELKEIAVTITDEETKEKFTVYIQGGTSWNANTPNARVAYGDAGEYYGTGYNYVSGPRSDTLEVATGGGLSSGEYNTALFGTSFVNRARNNTAFIGAGYSTNIGFDPVTKQVYGYVYGTNGTKWELYKRPILDLDDTAALGWLTAMPTGADKTLVAGQQVPQAFTDSKFVNYTVKVTVTEVADNKTAKFILYHLNGQSLAGVEGKLASNSGYGLYLPILENGFVGTPSSLPKPVAGAVIGGTKAFDGTVAIYDDQGVAVLPEQAYVEGITFTPTTTGTYKVVYGGMVDSNGFTRTKYTKGGYTGEEETLSLDFTVLDCFIAPTLQTVFRNTATPVGVNLLLADATVRLTIQKDGQVYDGKENVIVGQNDTYAFQEDGEYTLIYTATTTDGGSVSQTATVTVTVVGVQGVIVKTESVAVFGQDFIWSGDDFNVYYCDEGDVDSFVLTAQVYNGSEWVEVPATDGTINFKEAFETLGVGEWTVKFTVTVGEDSVSMERVMEVKDCKAPFISAGVLSTDFKADSVDDTETVKNFVIWTGATATVPSATAVDDVDQAVGVQILFKKPSEEVASVVEALSQISFDEKGVYTLVYIAVDEAGNESTFAYRIEARDLWLEIQASGGGVELGKTFTAIAPSVKNGFTDEAIEDFTWSVEISFNDVVVEKTGETWKLAYVGEYVLTYTVIYQDVEQTYQTTVVVQDTIKPAVTVDANYPTTAKIGDEITVVQAQVSDESTYESVVEVVYNGSIKIALENGKFVIDKAGSYVVRYTVSDISGNTETKEYTITVAEANASTGGSGGCFGATGTGTAIMVIALLITVLSIEKYKKMKEEKRGNKQ